MRQLRPPPRVSPPRPPAHLFAPTDDLVDHNRPIESRDSAPIIYRGQDDAGAMTGARQRLEASPDFDAEVEREMKRIEQNLLKELNMDSNDIGVPGQSEKRIDRYHEEMPPSRHHHDDETSPRARYKVKVMDYGGFSDDQNNYRGQAAQQQTPSNDLLRELYGPGVDISGASRRNGYGESVEPSSARHQYSDHHYNQKHAPPNHMQAPAHANEGHHGRHVQAPDHYNGMSFGLKTSEIQMAKRAKQAEYKQQLDDAVAQAPSGGGALIEGHRFPSHNQAGLSESGVNLSIRSSREGFLLGPDKKAELANKRIKQEAYKRQLDQMAAQGTGVRKEGGAGGAGRRRTEEDVGSSQQTRMEPRRNRGPPNLKDFNLEGYPSEYAYARALGILDIPKEEAEYFSVQNRVDEKKLYSQEYDGRLNAGGQVYNRRRGDVSNAPSGTGLILPSARELPKDSKRNKQEEYRHQLERQMEEQQQHQEERGIGGGGRRGRRQKEAYEDRPGLDIGVPEHNLLPRGSAGEAHQSPYQFDVARAAPARAAPIPINCAAPALSRGRHEISEAEIDAYLAKLDRQKEEAQPQQQQQQLQQGGPSPADLQQQHQPNPGMNHSPSKYAQEKHKSNVFSDRQQEEGWMPSGRNASESEQEKKRREMLQRKADLDAQLEESNRRKAEEKEKEKAIERKEEERIQRDIELAKLDADAEKKQKRAQAKRNEQEMIDLQEKNSKAALARRNKKELDSPSPSRMKIASPLALRSDHPSLDPFNPPVGEQMDSFMKGMQNQRASVGRSEDQGNGARVDAIASRSKNIENITDEDIEEYLHYQQKLKEEEMLRLFKAQQLSQLDESGGAKQALGSPGRWSPVSKLAHQQKLKDVYGANMHTEKEGWMPSGRNASEGEHERKRQEMLERKAVLDAQLEETKQRKEDEKRKEKEKEEKEEARIRRDIEMARLDAEMKENEKKMQAAQTAREMAILQEKHAREALARKNMLNKRGGSSSPQHGRMTDRSGKGHTSPRSSNDYHYQQQLQQMAGGAPPSGRMMMNNYTDQERFESPRGSGFVPTGAGRYSAAPSPQRNFPFSMKVSPGRDSIMRNSRDEGSQYEEEDTHEVSFVSESRFLPNNDWSSHEILKSLVPLRSMTGGGVTASNTAQRTHHGPSTAPTDHTMNHSGGRGESVVEQSLASESLLMYLGQRTPRDITTGNLDNIRESTESAGTSSPSRSSVNSSRNDRVLVSPPAAGMRTAGGDGRENGSSSYKSDAMKGLLSGQPLAHTTPRGGVASQRTAAHGSHHTSPRVLAPEEGNLPMPKNRLIIQSNKVNVGKC